MWSQIVTTSPRNISALPYTFTEQGVAKLSSVRRSPRKTVQTLKHDDVSRKNTPTTECLSVMFGDMRIRFAQEGKTL
ncbi:MAG: ORF6N domain-containing protein [Sulfuritalea sp.]|nr:ORF6N domain-containing protein [Sulfuritalea sp.]